jgi:hypothetical protein
MITSWLWQSCQNLISGICWNKVHLVHSIRTCGQPSFSRYSPSSRHDKLIIIIDNFMSRAFNRNRKNRIFAQGSRICNIQTFYSILNLLSIFYSYLNLQTRFFYVYTQMERPFNNGLSFFCDCVGQSNFATDVFHTVLAGRPLHVLIQQLFKDVA